MDLASMGTYGQMVDLGTQIVKDLYAQRLRSKYITPAAENYLRKAQENSGERGYSKAQNTAMQHALEIARGNIPAVAGNNMTDAQRMAAASNQTVDNDTSVAEGLNKAETTGEKSKVGIAEGKAGRQLESTMGAVNNAMNSLGQMASNPQVADWWSRLHNKIKGEDKE